MSRTDNDEVTRVSLFMPNLAGGGAERVTLLLAGGLVERGFDITVVVCKAEGAHISRVPQGVRVVELGNPHTSRCIPLLAKYLRAERPDVLISALNHANLAALLANRLSFTRTPVIPTVHTTCSMAAKCHRGIKNWILQVGMKRCYLWADAVVVVSEGSADDLVETTGIPREMVRVIFPPLTPGVAELSKEPIDHSWFRPDEPPVILAAGRLFVQKDYPTMIRAFAHLRNSRQCRLVILGEGEDRGDIEQLAKELGVWEDIDMPGFTQNPFAYMGKSSLFVLSSIYEAMPMVLTEAIASGTKVVSTDCESGPREILAKGRYGQLVPVGDIEALASAMSSALDGSPCGSPEDAIRPFSLDAVVDEYVKLINEVTDSQPT